MNSDELAMIEQGETVSVHKAIPLSPVPAAEPPPVAARADHGHESARLSASSIVVAATLAIWIVCLVVGVLGLRLGYPAAHVPVVDMPVVATIIHVNLSSDVLPTESDAAPAGATAAPPDNPELPPPVPTALEPPAAPPLMAVAEPSPAIAFALPVKGPSQVVDAKHAAPRSQPPAEAPAPTAAATAVRHLTFGQGEGAQPSPEYPPEAARAGQQGVVTVRFSVAESGKIISAEIVSPSRWPMLNQSALRAIRDRWHFDPGDRRLFEISIHFKLNEQ